MTKRRSISAIVPAKGTSQRFPNKNLAILGGESLVERKISQLKRSRCFGEIFVATDSEEIAQIAEKKNCKIIWRTREWADDHKGRSLSETIAFLAKQVSSDDLFWAQCTSPFVDENVISRAVELYRIAIDDGFDSLISQEVIRDFIWSEEGPLNYELGRHHVRSQDLPLWKRMTFGVLIAPRTSMISWNYYHGENPAIMTLSKYEAIDIDDGEDFWIAKLLAENKRDH